MLWAGHSSSRWTRGARGRQASTVGEASHRPPAPSAFHPDSVGSALTSSRPARGRDVCVCVCACLHACACVRWTRADRKGGVHTGRFLAAGWTWRAAAKQLCGRRAMSLLTLDVFSAESFLSSCTNNLLFNVTVSEADGLSKLSSIPLWRVEKLRSGRTI